jgi:hypothetical protein
MVTAQASRRVLLVVAAAGVVFGAVLFAAHSRSYLDEIASSDFAIDRVGAQQLLDGAPLYAPAAERARLFAQADTFDDAERAAMGTAFTDTYSSFISPPPVALAYVPWANGDYLPALASFRVVSALAMLAAVLVAGLALAREDRLVAWLVGVAALLVSFPVVSSLSLGQVDGFVMLALAVALWASTTRRWYVVGAALAVAVVLKVSPVLVLLLVVLRAGRDRVRVLVGAVGAAAVLLVSSAVVGRPGDLFTWVTDVAPSLATGNRTVENQSLPAALSRLFTHADDIVRTTATLGGWRFVGLVGGPLAVIALWRVRHRRAFEALELGAAILVALLAAPVSWEHYLSWAVLALMLLATPGRLNGPPLRVALMAGALVGATVLLALPVRFPAPEQVAAQYAHRIYSVAGTVALLVYLVVAVAMLTVDPAERAAPTGATADPPETAATRPTQLA